MNTNRRGFSKRTIHFSTRIVGVILLVLSAGFLQAAPKSPPPKLNLQDAPLSKEVKAATSFAPVVKKVGPSVVTIYSTMTVRERPNPLSDDPMLRRFFGEDSANQGRPHSRTAESLGSGVIVSQDGYILTANHVVEGADRIKVGLASGEQEYEAKVIGTDQPTDVAVIKIEARDLPAIAIADSDKLEVGDTVLAIGNPFEVGQSVTMGLVSALGRGGFGINDYEDFIQTDAAINPGNSGGALVDAEGRLVGINTAIFSRSGGNQGIGFAVPINLARFVMDRITTEGKVTRGYLGIDIQQRFTPELAREFGLPDESTGVMVAGTRPDSSAEKAGLKEGDLILEFNGKKVTQPRTLQLLVAQTPPGTKVSLRILRSEGDHKPAEKTVTVTLKELPAEALSSSNEPTPRERQRHPSDRDALDGVEVTDMDARMRRRFDLPSNLHGALVASVDQDSNSAQAGLRPGDVILEINRQPVHNADEAVALSEKVKGDHVLLRVWSQGAGGGAGGTHFVVVSNMKRK